MILIIILLGIALVVSGGILLRLYYPARMVRLAREKLQKAQKATAVVIQQTNEMETIIAEDSFLSQARDSKQFGIDTMSDSVKQLQALSISNYLQGLSVWEQAAETLPAKWWPRKYRLEFQHIRSQIQKLSKQLRAI